MKLIVSILDDKDVLLKDCQYNASIDDEFRIDVNLNVHEASIGWVKCVKSRLINYEVLSFGDLKVGVKK